MERSKNETIKLDLHADVNLNLQKILNALSEDNRQAQTTAADRYTELQMQFSTLYEKFAIICENLSSLECKNRQLQLELSELRANLNEHKQKELSHNVILNNVPEVEKDGKDLLSLVKETFSSLNLNNEEITIKAVKRLGKSTCDSMSGNRPILVSLREPKMCTHVIDAKRRKKALLQNTVRFNGRKLGSHKEQIFVNEQLTKYNATIYFEARKLRKLGFIKYVWIRNGTVFVREQDRKPICKISLVEDLDRWSTKTTTKPDCATKMTTVPKQLDYGSRHTRFKQKEVIKEPATS